MGISKNGIENGVLLVIAGLSVFLLLYKAVTKTESTGALPPELGIESLLSRVRSELVQAAQSLKSSGKDPLFALRSFDIEVNFVVKQSRTARGELNTQLVAVSTDTQVDKEQVQKVVVHLVPLANEPLSAGAAKELNAPASEVLQEGETPQPGTGSKKK